MTQPQTLYNSRITKVRFSLPGDEGILQDSHVAVTAYDLYRDNLPYPGGVCNAHLGTTDYSYKCQTCHNSKRSCPGHAGHIALNYPVWNIIAVPEGRRWLKLICFKCGHPIVEESKYAHFPRAKRLDEAAKLARNGNRKCIHCKAIHPVVNKDPKEPLLFTAELHENKRAIEKKPLYPHKISKYLSRISDVTVLKLGKSLASHPRNFILHYIQVPSVIIRPDVRKIGGGRSNNDDLTTILHLIVKKNESMPAVIPKVIDVKLAKSILEINNTYYDFIKAGGDDSATSIAKRLKGKNGRFRKNQMGKRARGTCRSTITNDSSLMIDEVGVPLVFARTIQYEETMQEYNKARLLGYIQNGSKKYPGASKIIDRNGVERSVESADDIDIKNGDKILRDMIDGDPVNYNRQPSLMISNVSTHKAKVITDPDIKTLPMNVLATPLYNADFDGDQMNLLISAGIAPRNEIAELASVPNWFISHTTSSPSMGQVDDSIIGSAELTRSHVVYDKYHAMLLCQNTTILPSFSKVGPAGITGRECMSKLLEETPINFSRNSQWYDPNMAAHLQYDPTEIRVNIDRGVILSGILDKKSIGKGSTGGIYHIIANEYGAKKALEVMFNMQQMANGHILRCGYTIGIMDLVIPHDSKLEIDSIAADIINQSQLISEELNNGEIIPPIGKTVEQFFEERQINTLRIFDNFTDPILKAITPNTNNLFKLIMCGSKGKIEHMFNMVSAIGQKLINGERIRTKFGFKRTLPYYSRFDNSPASRGYITNSYLTGMTSSEYIFNAMASRFDLISKALSTSVTGEQNRKSIKNLESIIINNFRWAAKNMNIVQFSYGEDFLDARKVERVRFPTVMISNESFQQKYSHADYPEFFAQMTEDREAYRNVFLNIEQMNIKELMSDERRMPVEIERIVKDITRENADLLKKSVNNLAELVSAVDELCNTLPYVLINDIQAERKSKIPEHILVASWLLCMLVRSHLHPRALEAMGMTMPVLQIIIDKIKLRYAQALIDPGTAAGIIAAQSFSEPLTQYMLDAHHRSASGGTSKGAMTSAKEILGAKPVSKLIAPSMYIPVKAEYANNKAKVQEIANNIEVMNLRQFVIVSQIFFEKYGAPVHTMYAHEAQMIRDYTKTNPLLAPPGDLAKWCIRMVLNKTTLILKNMSLEYIVTKLREAFPDTFIVYTPENTKQIILRIYVRTNIAKGSITLNVLREFKDSILNTVIRGVIGIISTELVKMLRNTISADGSIVRAENLWAIVTRGTNMQGIFNNALVDKCAVLTDAVQEVAALLGVEAARQKVAIELRNLVADINHRHYLIYADEMTYTGRVTSIENTGLKTREASNILLRVGFSSPLAVLEEAALNAMEDSVTGITAPLLLGSVPRHGTLYNSFHINEKFVQENVAKPDDIVDTLFD